MKIMITMFPLLSLKSRIMNVVCLKLFSYILKKNINYRPDQGRYCTLLTPS